MFVNKAISELKVLHAAVSTNDVAEIWRLADSLKSGSANLGAQQMTAVYEQLYGTSSPMLTLRLSSTESISNLNWSGNYLNPNRKKSQVDRK